MKLGLNKSQQPVARKSLSDALPRASAVLLALTLMAILFNVATMMSNSFDDKSAPQAIKGELNLSHFDLAEVSSIPLSGNWALYWQQLLTPEQVTDAEQPPHYHTVPNSWIRSNINGQPLPNHGFATYQVKVVTAKAYNNLALQVPILGTAYRLYVDNKLLSQGGQVGTSEKTSEARYNAKTLVFEPQSNEFTITLQVSNFDYYWGGMWVPMRLGETANLQQQQYQQILRSTFLVAIFLIVALFNLIQFTLRSADPLPFIIALTCMLLGIRELVVSQTLQIVGIVSWDFATNARMNFLSFYATVPLMVLYFHITFWQDFKKWVMGFFYLVCIIASLIVIFTPPAVFSQTMSFFQGFTIICMPYIIWGLIQAVRNRRKSSRLLTLGSIFLFALVINDILYNLGIINTALTVSFGLVAFVLCQNYLTYIRFIEAGIQNEELSKTLEVRNKELQDFSQSLEEKVEQRTDELAKANQKLSELANKDMLTGLPNRRGLMPHIEESLVQFRHAHTPFCLLLVDFDHFKILNDTLGHEIGDQVLSEGAEVMRNALRDQDYVARWGGEEFLILLPGTPISGADTLASKVKNTLRDTLTSSIGSKVSVTIGVAEFNQKDSLKACLKRADDALYQGKNQGRDTVVLAKN